MYGGSIDIFRFFSILGALKEKVNTSILEGNGNFRKGLSFTKSKGKVGLMHICSSFTLFRAKMIQFPDSRFENGGWNFLQCTIL
jgi:hypothetical protein